ncbi:ABC transporter ATP-binding protein [Rhodococcus sp. AD45-ID]|uniref:ABC transporter ATP-binding protein n=1 Tax=unclassified Rhodococcus (in: high G+C Gram-positive bacteria) TaxID=192944 RepID=UPI0005D34F44|nr:MULTISPECIES: ABC transporter ATP-binding protein [unclassified Rhodococcus (in: high G+C Gram-positive bacteria)]KJF24790.1 Aliphatic sulfonates import ATP-binding protein SsuB [Rhodococcus sp. AD45]PSR43040.1 ABC transporter ATP-binding protein [Rhodococcus sp. AD45-ID]
MSIRDTGVRASGIVKTFGDRTILDGFSLDVQPGEFVALLGASGSGKTTFLRILAGLEGYDAGEVHAPDARTVVFQEPRLIASKRVQDNVILGQRATRKNREAATAALAEVSLAGRERAWPTTLSGGEAQRVALARALVRNPQLLLLDEPFAALDALTRLRMQALVAELCRKHRPAVLLVTHDIDEAILLADRIAVLRDGRLSVLENVSFAQPRNPAQPGYTALRTRLLEELGVHESVGAAHT